MPTVVTMTYQQITENELVSVRTFRQENSNLVLEEMEDKVLPYSSADEINYLAFDLANIEYHNQLYGLLQEESGQFGSTQLDDYLERNYSEIKSKIWQRETKGMTGNSEQVTLHTFIRHKVHHPENESMQSQKLTYSMIKDSVKRMREIVLDIKKSTTP